jgi:hypothetical protein
MSAYIKRTKRSQISDLMLYLNLLQKQEETNLKQAEGENNKNKG